MSKDKEAVAAVALYFSIMLTVGLGFIIGWHTGNPFITIGTALMTLPITWLVFAYILAKMN